MTETQVECYSGSRYGEQPRAFYWHEVRMPVSAILKRWRIPGAYYFLVKSEDDLVYELCYQESTDKWHVEFASQNG